MRPRRFDGNWDGLVGAEVVCPNCARVLPSVSSFDRHLFAWQRRMAPGYLEEGGPWCKYETAIPVDITAGQKEAK